MKLGENIQKLRKDLKLSQEQLAEKVDVTRQTISNWELGETSPNPEQLKLLSKALNVSIDELLNNDIKSVIIDKVSNTEKLAGIIIRILKVIGVLIIGGFIFTILSVVLFSVNHKTVTTSHTTSIEMFCSMNNNDYIVEVGSDGYFNCSNCSKDMMKDLKEKYIDYGDIEKTAKEIEKYFKLSNGKCE